MNYLKISLFFIGVIFTFESNAQSQNSFIVKIDSVEIDIYNNYESDDPTLNLNRLREPTLFLLNDKELKISKFSEFEIEDEKIESITITQNQNDIKEMGYDKYKSIVAIETIR